MSVRIREKELAVPTLRIAANRPNGEISTTDLIKALTEWFEPEGEDAELLERQLAPKLPGSSPSDIMMRSAVVESSVATR
jgi:hypothetical protein